jgi:hypothetical protein
VKKNRWHYRIFGNWLTAFLSPLSGGTATAFILPATIDPNMKILFTAFASSLIVTGFVVARELERRAEN